MADTTERPDREKVDAAWATLRQHAEYETMGGGIDAEEWIAHRAARWAAGGRVVAVCRQLGEEIGRGEITTVDQLDERMREEVESHLTYTLTADVYILGTDNGDAYTEEYPEAPDTQAVAYCAMLADVRDSFTYAELVHQLGTDTAPRGA